MVIGSSVSKRESGRAIDATMMMKVVDIVQRTLIIVVVVLA